MKYITPCLAVICALVLWEYFPIPFVLPPPSSIAAIAINHADRLGVHALATLREMLGGLALAVVISFPLALLMISYQSFQRWIQGLIIISQCFPMFALAPLMVIWFGWGYTAVIVPTALMIFFPLTLAIYRGLASVPGEYLDLFRLQRATWFQTVIWLRFPWAWPQICSGFRVAAGLSAMGAIVGEWAGAQEGLGLLMLESRRAADLPLVFASIASLFVLGMTIYLLATLIEKRYIIAICCLSILGVLSFNTRKVESTLVSPLILTLDWLPNPNHIPIFAGVEKGFFAAHNIPLKILKVHDPSDVVPYVNSQQADIGITYMPSYILGPQAQGTSTQVLGYLIKEPLNALIIRKGVDVNNCCIGFASDGIQDALLTVILQNKGFQGPTVNLSFDLISMLATRQVDAIFGAYWNIEPENLKQLGIETHYLTMEELGVPRHFELIFISSNPRIDSHSFRAALQASIDWCRENPKEAFALYANANPDKSADTLAWEERAWIKTLPILADHQDDEPEVWQDYQTWLAKHHLLPKSF